MKEQFNDSLANLVDKLKAWLNTIVESVPNFILAILVMVLAYFLANYVGKLVGRITNRQIHKKSISTIVTKIVTVIIMVIGLFIALGILNLSKALTSLLAGAGVIGLVVGFALQDTLSNTVSGIIISFRDKIRIGNWVETNGFSGEILDVNLKNFVLKEADNNIVLIPNKAILENPLKNYSLTDKIRVTVACGVGYESDLEQVKFLTTQTISETFEDPKSPEEVEFYYTEFGDSSINFICRFWTKGIKAKDKLEATSIAILAIKKAFDKENINIPFPIRTLEFNNRLQLQKEEGNG
ncbi:small conductance mechanosensitive channel [Flavobacteriaceae bacterium MAR_2010_188]|nr:small conductance mechanosensitive channel [Flavobacteriaceae bacterium MAR_2010_188]